MFLGARYAVHGAPKSVIWIPFMNILKVYSGTQVVHRPAHKWCIDRHTSGALTDTQVVHRPAHKQCIDRHNKC